MRYAEVSVNSPAAQRRTFSYAIPPGLTIEAGQVVLVPFGNKILQGVALELTDHPAVEEVREITGPIGPGPLLSPSHLSLARWISEHYLSPLFDAVSLMLPPGFERSAVTFVSPTGSGDEAHISERQRQVLQLAGRSGRVSLRQLEGLLGRKGAQSSVSQLVSKGLVSRSYELRDARARPKMVRHVGLAVDVDTARDEAAALRKKRGARQADLLEFLTEQAGPVPVAEATEKAGTSPAAVTGLVKKGLVTVHQIEVRRQPFAHQGIEPSQPLRLTSAQQSAFDAIQSCLQGNRKGDTPPVFLLHGVTGSGKTEVYLQALAETLRLGKRGIVLVPEIALTAQTVERFAARFPNRVAVLHSQLSAGERFDEWQAISRGEFDVVIGPRSAIFAPQPDLGLIVLDEEHEWTYKQQDISPRYHARDAAIKLAELAGAVVVLGSATPDVETYHRAESGGYHLLALPERIIPGGQPVMPEVEVVDLRDELKAGNRSIFSRALFDAIETTLAKGEQTILFLNRRGAATSVQCRSCGHVLTCPNCEIPLSYHSSEERLLCHQCNYRTRVAQSCPHCGSRRIKYLGIGTQKLEQETRASFPGARLLRWDSDVTRRKGAHQAILNQFRNHEADILIGTQMVAKGLDLPQVTLVGVIIADTGLNLPDFRAGERTFQLLCQVAGRAGRSTLGGQVIVQTYSPEHYAIAAAAHHDYAVFYRKEIDYRRQLNDPPFTRLARLTFTHGDDARCQREAERAKTRLTEELDVRGISGISLIGPAPAMIHRLRGQYRWQLILRGREPSAFLEEVPLPQGWTIDIDPVGS